MSDDGRKPSRPKFTVAVEEADAPPIDLEAWCDRYVAMVLELEGVKPRVAPPPLTEEPQG